MSSIQSLRRKVRAFAALESSERLAVLRAAIAALAVEIGLRIFSLPALCRWLRVTLSDDALVEETKVTTERALDARELRDVRAVSLVFRNWPFGGPCLRRSLVLGYFLRRRRSVLRIGVDRREGLLNAHAWLEVGGNPLLGDADAAGFVPLGRPDPEQTRA